jgi:glycosyltransferase involved in cell wall biosynthesis
VDPSTPAHTDHGEAPAGGGASVIVCTFSPQRLEQTIACVKSVVEQRPPPAEVIVVVDHNDDLRASLSARLPAHVEVVANAGAPGLSSARNTAVELSRGDPIVFIDDDAVAHEHWLARLLCAFEDPLVFGVGGHALPAWEHRQPAWFPDEFLWVVGCSYRGLAESGPVRNPLGCNMAFRADIFDRIGLFDPGMGRLGSRPLGCEETEFCIRLTRSVPGAQLVLVSGADVDHWVPQDRERPSYLLRRCYYEGISKALVRRLGDTRSLDPERTYVRRTLPSRVGRSMRLAASGPGRIAALGQIAAVIGGLAATVAGYAFGTVAFGVRPPAESAPAGA